MLRYRLPKSDEQMTKAVSSHIVREQSRVCYKQAIWRLSHAYLNGARQFIKFDTKTGRVLWRWTEDETSQSLPYQSSDLLSLLDRIKGRLNAMDLTPLVARSGDSIEAIRDRAVADIVLSSQLPDEEVNRIKARAISLLVDLGTVGVTARAENHNTLGLVTGIEVIHPSELFPFPSIDHDINKLSGIVRQRLVPLDELVEMYGPRVKSESNMRKMEVFDRDFGDSASDDYADLYEGGFSRQRSQSRGDNKLRTVRYVRVRELWLDGPGGTVSEYASMSGDYVFARHDLSSHEVYRPIHIIKYVDTGSFYGVGAFEMFWSIHRQREKLEANLFTNARDIDRHGILVMPAGSFNPRKGLEHVDQRLKVYTYDRDVAGDDFRPYVIQPASVSDFPQRVANYAREAMEAMNPIRDLVENKGRVESAAGLQILDERLQEMLSTPAGELQRGFSGLYRYTMSMLNSALLMAPRPIKVNKLSLDLAGAVIDPESDTITFVHNPIPDMRRLRFDIREANPQSTAAKKMEAKEMLTLGISDPDTFMMYVIEEGLDLAAWIEDRRSAHLSIIRMILTVVNDGESPGQIVFTPDMILPDYQLRILSAFMAGPVAFRLSPEVLDSLADLKQALMGEAGVGFGMLPEGVPNPDELLGSMTGGGNQQQRGMGFELQQGAVQ